MKNKIISFSFRFVTKETILNELHKLNSKKARKGSDISVKIIKENLDIVSNFLYKNFKNFINSHHTKKMQKQRPFLKRNTETTMEIILQ